MGSSITPAVVKTTDLDRAWVRDQCPGLTETLPGACKLTLPYRIGVRYGSSGQIDKRLRLVTNELAGYGYQKSAEYIDEKLKRIHLQNSLENKSIMLFAQEVSTNEPGFCAPLFADMCAYEITAFGFVDRFAALDTDFSRELICIEKMLLPFTQDELRKIRTLNPLTWELARGYLRKKADLSEITLIVREHMLLEKLNLLTALFAIGLRPEQTYVIRKPDHTLYQNRVRADLEVRGVTVVDAVPSNAVSSIVYEIIEKLVDSSFTGPILILDDGADAISAAYANAEDIDVPIFAIETTTKGITQLKQSGLYSRVIDLANCPAKKNLALQIAVSCVHRFRELMQHEPIGQQWCHVVGFGQLGSHVARLLTEIGVRVSVSETREEARVLARTAGFETYSSVSAGLSARPHRYLFGCSGHPSVRLEDISTMISRPVLCSISSQDLAPLLSQLRTTTPPRTLRGVGCRYDTEKQSITILGCGHAVNLFLSEGVPEPDFDSFTATVYCVVVEQALSGEPLSAAVLDRLGFYLEATYAALEY